MENYFMYMYVICLSFDLFYCELVIIRHVPIFAIFVSVRNDEFTYWRI